MLDGNCTVFCPTRFVCIHILQLYATICFFASCNIDSSSRWHNHDLMDGMICVDVFAQNFDYFPNHIIFFGHNLFIIFALQLLTGNHPPRYQALQDSRNDPRGRDIPDTRWEFTQKEESPERASFLSSSKKPSSDDFTSPASPNPRDERSKKWAPFLYLTDLVKRGSYSATLIVMMVS